MVIDRQNPDSSAIADAVSLLSRGELVVVPTETVYGLLADPDNPDAMQKLYAAKGRDEGKPVAYLVSDTQMIKEHDVQMGKNAMVLADAFWPGPLTLVLSSPAGLRGFRMPDHPLALAVIRTAGKPLAATSANKSGEEDSVTVDQAIESFGDRVSLYLDAGPADHQVASTVVQVNGDDIRLLRKGSIGEAALRDALVELS